MPSLAVCMSNWPNRRTFRLARVCGDKPNRYGIQGKICVNPLTASMSFSYRIIRVAAIAIACLAYCEHKSFSNEAAPESNSATVEKAAEAADTDDPATAAELKRQRGRVTIASVLLVGICIVGL